jgi:hypothetical protein
MMYLLLSVAGHLTIFQTRTRGPWWSIRPARILFLAVLGTQILATAICLTGFLVTRLWWGWAAMVWVYAIAWFLLTDPLKLLAYRVLDATSGVVAPTAAAAPADAEATLVGTMLGDLRQAGVLSDPDQVGRVMAKVAVAAKAAAPAAQKEKA